MERKEAIEVVKKNYPHVTESGSQFETALRTLIPELKESEDERIRKNTISIVEDAMNGVEVALPLTIYKESIAWLEKQGEHANFCNKIQIGDKVTRNEDGVLVNLSQLKRIAKKDEKQGEQKSEEEVDNLHNYLYGEYKPTDEVGNYDHKEVLQTIINEQKSAWSEEDEMMLECVLDKIEDLGTGAMCKEWLKSLKERIKGE